MKAQPLALKQINHHRVAQASAARQQAADAFRQRQLDAALKRLLAAESGERATKEMHGKGIQSSITSSDTRNKPTLSDIGIKPMQSSRYQKLAAIPEESGE